MIKDDPHVFQGLRRDNHQIRQDSKFLWDAHNIRITNRDDNTLYAITNERGTLNTHITFKGTYLGHCVLKEYLVVFTKEVTNDGKSFDYIYRVHKEGNNYKKVILFRGDLKFNLEYPIKTLGTVENKLIYKVYWIDGFNQPRLIIISKPENNNIIKDDYTDILYKQNDFNFISTLQLKEKIKIKKSYGQGIFSSGVIQYAFTYYNKYAQESNIFYTSPLQYISQVDKAGRPDKPVANTFTIEVTNLDENFDYLRVYSIHRTSLNGTPEVKQLPDIELSSIFKDPQNTDKKAVIIDTGTTGEVIDSTKLLYVGGREIKPQCMESKDNTLFLGNIQLNEDDSKIIEILNEIDKETSIIQNVEIYKREFNIAQRTFYYNEDYSLNNGYFGGFKSNETYRLGVQAQLFNGRWTQPSFIADIVVTDKYPQYTKKSYTESSPSDITQYGAKLNISNSIKQKLKAAGVRKLRTCVVFPSIYDRDIICQGVLNPTVYNGLYRSKNAPYAQASWFFRPTKIYKKNEVIVEQNFGGNIETKHNYALGSSTYGHEIQNMELTSGKTIASIKDSQNYSQNYYVDENIVTFNSPDIEFDSSIINADISRAKLKIIGYIQLDSIFGDVTIQTSSPTLGSDSTGFTNPSVGYDNFQERKNKNNGGLVSYPMYQDAAIKNDYTIYKKDKSNYYIDYGVCAFHRSGSLNNDAARPEDKGTRSAVLKTKAISNLKFFSKLTPINSFTDEKRSTTMDICSTQVFNSDEVTILKLKPGMHLTSTPIEPDAIYEGNIDTVAISKVDYTINWPLPVDAITTSREPVRIKYKSSPHIVFRFTNNNNNTQTILPRHVLATSPGDNIALPSWIIEGNPADNISEGTKIETSEKYGGVLSSVGLTITDHNQELLSNIDPNELVYCYYNNAFMLGKREFSQEQNKYIMTKILKEGESKYYKVTRNTIFHLGKNFTKEDVEALFPDIHYTLIEQEPLDSVYLDTYAYVVIDSNGGINRTNDYTVPTTQSKSTKATTTNVSITYDQATFGDLSDEISPYLLVAELINTDVKTKFGGSSKQALTLNKWLPAGDPVDIDDLGTVDLLYKYGDTWYSRYDCLKTYPFTQEDENKIVEIGSFMCETRVNLEGRYDNNKGNLFNTTTTPQNFNKLNPIYNQQDNYFQYNILDDDYYKLNTFENQLTWTLEKFSGSNIDNWTNITLGSTLDLDGSKGKITAIKSWNNVLLAFQEKAMSKLEFNVRTQIPTSDGVPIEISNGQKMGGSLTINDNTGCSDERSIVTTPSGIYYYNKETNGIYMFDGQINNLSISSGIEWWVKKLKNNSLQMFYDYQYKDLYFTPDNEPSLGYSEKVQAVISQYDYNGVNAMFNYGDGFYSLYPKDKILTLYENFKGDYNQIFDNPIDWSISFISNDQPSYTKVFDTIELDSDVFKEEECLHKSPINYIEVSNEYQKGITNDPDIKYKFRIWRALIPRNNGTRQRIRNLWSQITIGHKKDKEDYNNKVLIHNLNVKYTI